MWRHAQHSPLEILAPRSAADRRVLYGLIRQELGARFPERGDAVSMLALAAVRYLGGDGIRILIRGPAESQGEALIRALVEILDLPFLEVETGSLAEVNWSGADMPSLLEGLRAGLALRYSPSQVPALAERACILVAGLDRARLPTSYASASTREHRIGKQQSLAQLIGGGSIPVAPDRGRGFIWRGGHALIAVTAEFRDLGEGVPSSTDLRSWGTLPELADALASGAYVALGPPSRAEIEHRLRGGLERLADWFLQFGCHLRVEEQVIRYVADVVEAGVYGGGVAAGVRWITAAAEAALVRLLEEGSASGMVWVLARDDLSLPDPPKGLWRE
jgi:hypothetical protein